MDVLPYDELELPLLYELRLPLLPELELPLLYEPRLDDDDDEDGDDEDDRVELPLLEYEPLRPVEDEEVLE